MSYLSETDGQVVSISEDLDNPVIMIRSEAAAVKGELDEKELQKVAEGQETAVESGTLKKDFTGKVAAVQTMPETPLSTETQASYPFTIELDQAQEKLENLHPGMQLNVEITTGEAKDAVIAPSKSIMKQNDKEYAIVLNEAGKTEKREIQQGLKVKGSSEVVSGLEQQEPLMLHPKPAAEISREFFTPFSMDKFYPGALKDMTSREKLKYFLLGMFNR
jgi:HlyD family secretion protein